MSETPTTDQAGQEVASLEPGVVWRGTVVRLDDEQVELDLGDGARGAFPRFEIAHWTRQLAPGEELEVLVDDQTDEGAWKVSVDKLEKVRVFDRIGALIEDNAMVQGVVMGRVRGGLSVDIGVKAFLPARESGMRNHELDQALGQTLTCQIQKFDARRNSITLTRKAVAEAEAEAAKAALFERLNVGDVVTGAVVSLAPSGAFVDLGGGDGLIHVSELSWERVDHPKDVLSVGDTVRVKVLEINAKRERIGLSLKLLKENPWDTIVRDFEPGKRLTGAVTSVAEFGVFVQLTEGVEGLVHISELSWERNIKHPSEVVQEGQQLEVVVLEVDTRRQRVSLSHKRLQASPWEQALEDLEAGQTLEGTVTSVVEFGVFVEIKPGVEGLVHVSDMSWTERIGRPSDLRDFKEGDTCMVRVLNIDQERQRIALGIKQLTRDPWADAQDVLKPNTNVDVVITRVAPYGAFAQVAEGVEGLIHVSELAVDRVNRVEDVVHVGQQVKARITGVDERSRKVSLSIKAFLELDTMREYIDEAPATAAESPLAAALRAKGLVSDEGGEG